MKTILKDALWGLLVFVVIYLLEFVVTLPFGDPGSTSDPAVLANLINLELLLAAVPAALTTFVFAWLLKTKSKTGAFRRGLIWTVIIALFYVIIGIGNQNLGMIFSKIGIYVLLVCSFSGPLLFAKIKHLH